MRDYNKHVLKKISNGKVRKLYRCQECFTPLLLKMVFRWDSGTVALRLLNRDFRFAFLDNDLLTEILNILGSHFGEDEVYEIAQQIERKTSSGYVAMLFGAEQWWLKPFSFLAKYSFLMDYVLEMNASLLGYAATNVADKNLPNAMVYIRNPYNMRLFMSDLEGVYLVIRDREVDCAVDMISEDGSICLYYADASTPRVPGIYNKYRLKPDPIVHTEEICKSLCCPRCGVPKQIGMLWWDPRNGMIVNRETKKRVIIWPRYTLEYLLRTLSEHFGKEATILIANTVKRYQRESILNEGIGFSQDEKMEFVVADKEGQYELLLGHLACTGYGHGKVFIEGEDRVRIEMTNPMIPVVTSGLLAGMVEALEDQSVNVSWEEGEKTTTYTLEWL